MSLHGKNSFVGSEEFVVEVWNGTRVKDHQIKK